MPIIGLPYIHNCDYYKLDEVFYIVIVNEPYLNVFTWYKKERNM